MDKVKLLRITLSKVILSWISIILIFTITFFLLEAIPGEVYDIDNIKNKVVAENIRQKYNLDASVTERYFTSLKNLLAFDFGYSFINEGRSVNEIIAVHFPISAAYGIVSLFCSVISSIFLGVILSRRKSTTTIATYFIAIAISFPSFAIASLLQYLLCVKAKLFPAIAGSGMFSSILPIAIISLPLILMQTRLLMNKCAEIRQKDFTVQAISLNVGKKDILFLYLLKNSLTSILTYLGVAIADVMVGSFVVETTFNIPGLGRYYINSITNRDYPVVMALTIFYAILIISFTTIFDIIATYMNYSGNRVELYENE